MTPCSEDVPRPDKHHDPTPPWLPQKKWKVLGYYVWKVLGYFGFGVDFSSLFLSLHLTLYRTNRPA